MPRSHHRPHARRHLIHQPSPLFRTRDWLGRERVAFTYRKRRYMFRRVEAATWARHRLILGQRSSAGCFFAFGATVVLVIGAWFVLLQPAFFPDSPIAIQPQQVWLVRAVRDIGAKLGDSTPRWNVPGVSAAEQSPTVIPSPTQTPIPPTATPTPTASATATAVARPEIVIVLQGGNLRREPRLEESNVLGWVVFGDQLEVLGREDSEEGWLHVRLVHRGETKNARPVTDGTTGWVSVVLLEHGPATATPVPPTPTLAPLAPLLFKPTPEPSPRR